MKKLMTILFAVALGLNLSAQTDYVDDWNPDADGDDLIGITDLLRSVEFVCRSRF